jgi:glycerol-3-phosphate dehydrogenase (NAD(P)+)
MTKKKHIAILGAGAWGTALALSMHHAGHQVTLLPRREEHADEINKVRENQRYLKGIHLNPSIVVSADLSILKTAEVFLWVIPTQHSNAMAAAVLPYLPSQVPVVICSKGIDTHQDIINENSLLTSVLTKSLPNPMTVLSGPNFAMEVAQGLPAAATLAAFSKDLAFDLAQILRHQYFRVYASDDPIGVQIAGATKNVIAIACGIVLGKNLGNNANAALITRGLAEIRRLGVSLGGKIETFLGLAAVGDLTLTCSSKQSRNMTLGMGLGEGQKLEDILKGRNTVAEGVYTAKAVCKFATTKKISMPICRAVYEILYDKREVNDAINSILSRQSDWEEF